MSTGHSERRQTRPAGGGAPQPVASAGIITASEPPHDERRDVRGGDCAASAGLLVREGRLTGRDPDASAVPSRAEGLEARTTGTRGTASENPGRPPAARSTH